MLSSSRGVVLLALVFLGLSVGAADPVRELLLFDFERSAGQFNAGGEFPGATGAFAVLPAAAHDGTHGGRLTFDLTRGAYVAWTADLPVPLAEGASELTVWVRADAPGRVVHCKTRDQTGQEHIRHAAPLAPGGWQRLTFDLTRHTGHWNGANDGVIHWPITALQIGVETKDAMRTGSLDLDTITVSTTAPPSRQPGLRMRLDTGRFGNLFGPGEPVEFAVLLASLETRPAAALVGAYVVHDWQDREVGRGPLGPLSPALAGEQQTALRVALPGCGAFRLSVELRTQQEPVETAIASTWFGVLSGPTPPPCAWVGTGVHASHGWANDDLRFLDILTAAGIGVVREEFGWSGIEKVQGEYALPHEAERFAEALSKRGIRLNLLLTYGNPIYANPLDPDAYARWAAWMATHFSGRVSDFEIWNEPANFMFQKQYGGERFGNAPWIGKFVELSLKAGAAIRSVRPDARIVLCAEDCWPTLQQMLEEGIGPAGNVISIHPYCHGQPRPEREWFLNDGGSALRRLSRAHGGPERVVITEAGWTTYEGEMQYLAIAGGYPRSSPVHQAQYIVRLYLTAKACGADYAVQYDFRDDGPNRSYTEHNFGLVHEDASPKPALLAVAALTRLLGQGSFRGDVSPEPARLRAYVFNVGGAPVVAAYALEGSAELDLPVGVESVDVVDLMGNRTTLACAGAVAHLSLTEAPIYITGGALEAVGRFCQVSVGSDAVEGVAGDTVRVPLTVANRSGRSMRARVRCLAPAGVAAAVDWGRRWLTPRVADGADQAGEVVIHVPAAATAPFVVNLDARLGGQRLPRTVTVRPRAPLVAQFGTLVPVPGGGEGSIRLTNLAQRRLEVVVTVSLATLPPLVLPELRTQLGPAESRLLTLALPVLAEGPLTATARLATADGWQGEVAAVLLPGLVSRLATTPDVDGALGEWGGATHLALALPSQYAALPEQPPRRGPEDSAALVQLGWCAAGLAVAVEVSDDVLYQPYADEQIWQADSVQLAVAPGLVGEARLEVSLARTPAGDRCFTTVAPGSAAAPPLRYATRPAATGAGIVYELLIPWAQLPGLAPAVGSRFRFSLLVNDNDGAGRRGWLHAFDGIGWSKDPALYGVLTLGGAGGASR